MTAAARLLAVVAAFIAAVTLAAVSTDSASAATPRQIYSDLADGRLDRTYSRAELQRAFRDASVQTYGSGTAPTRASLAARHARTVSATRVHGTLPFTGSQLGLMAALGLGLLAGGSLLHASGRGRRTTPPREAPAP